jgi:hypothetical protein
MIFIYNIEIFKKMFKHSFKTITRNRDLDVQKGYIYYIFCMYNDDLN